MLRCRLKWKCPAHNALIAQLISDSAKFYINNRVVPGRVDDTTFTSSNGDICKRVEFEPTSEKVSICLTPRGFPPQDISGSSFSLEKWIQAQRLDSSFGQANHRKRKIPSFFEQPHPDLYTTTLQNLFLMASGGRSTIFSGSPQIIYSGQPEMTLISEVKTSILLSRNHIW